MKYIKLFELYRKPIIDMSGSMRSHPYKAIDKALGYYVHGVDEHGILSNEDDDYIFMTFEEFSDFEKRNLVVYEGDLPYGQPSQSIYSLKDKQKILEELELMRTAKKYNL
jgi:hypothetical protein